MLFIRSLFFYIFFISSIIFVSLLINILYLFTSTSTLQNICKYWIELNNEVLSFLCKINYIVTGYENLPNEPCIIIANHQGPWESLFVQTLKIPSSSIIKKNLTMIPFFGWGLAALKPIRINRETKLSSLKKVVSKSVDRLKNGSSVIIFPEGTRNNAIYGPSKFSASFARVGMIAEVPIVPVCHNSGKFWINKTFTKNPGTIKVKIGKPFLIKNEKLDVMEIEEWFRKNYKALNV
tara:strand:+ start:38 stop:745 length:708 start_codon:yes stop_codon:yes gene_type:complete